MKAFQKYKSSYYFPILLFFLSLLLGISSCSTTKYVGENEYLLNRVVVKTDDRSVPTSDLKKNIKQKSNLKILGMWRFHLGLYNLSGKNEEKGFNKWLRRIGEEPVIYEDFQTMRSVAQLQLYMKKKGYYNAVIKDSVAYKKKKAKVYYTITANEPYRYRNLYHQLDDLPYNFLSPSQKAGEMSDSTQIRGYVNEDKIDSKVKTGKKVDSDVLSEERMRIFKMLKNQGYFNFSREYIHFMMDSTKKDHQMDIFVGLKEPLNEKAIKKYRINKVKIFTEYDPKLILMNDSTYLSELDTLVHKDVEFIYRKKLKIKPDVILSSILIKKGDLYNLTSVEQSYSRLQQLNQFKFLNVRFEEDTNAQNNEFGSLNCEIHLSPHNLQFYSFELEGTNSSGNIGFAGNLNYQHKNLFGGAEVLDIQFSTARENVKSDEQTNFSSSEYGVVSKLSIPKFLLPFFDAEKFRKSYNPRTVFSLSYNFQKRPDYTRTIADASFGYFWKSSKYLRHTLNLIELNFVDVKDLSEDFLDDIDNLYIQNSFTDHVIATTRYSVTYNDQNINIPRSYNYIRFSGEVAGNTLKAIDNILGRSKRNDFDSDGNLEGTYHDFLGIRYAQYVKGDIEYRFNQYINRANNMVYRVFFGIGYPYGNLEVLPFEKSYFSGGANGIRAWQARSLGPGSYIDEGATYPNNTADLKVEANLEYRFKLFWALEGALFLDAGNIWAISNKDDREGADFQFNRFYKEIALGTGFGTRVDLNFILFRLDLGLKLRDPSRTSSERWIIAKRPFKFNQLTFNIGIGYPF
ncbi:BamA/TamA family outer membrane protein [Marinifilum caeruleilacunae]|uniref:Outer membrane protein assembly factor n=1 Tax=Marinifilum caeruleilacunae TaxID=2499076 RepID=A0ABX1WYP0_9BACT|nr:BamA/TamA family outer membrane protein [Marinifilum caeruleilacunae]NOU61211.1 outer membrane protein assembly factor [Marinifilum caeruleilacunae]